MTELFHLAIPAEWEQALAVGGYERSTRGVSLAEEGFIHCSLRHQVQGVAERFYADVDELLLLRIDSTKVGAPIRFEPPVPGAAEEFPHIYGPLPVDAVTAVERYGRPYAPPK